MTTLAQDVGGGGQGLLVFMAWVFIAALAIPILFVLGVLLWEWIKENFKK